MPSTLCNVGCSGSNFSGYSTIDDLNCQIENDWNQVQRGESVPAPPTYILCPNTVFNMTSSVLTLLLSNSLLLCGSDGALSNKCVLTNVTVEIQNLDSTSIRGLTFHSSSLSHTGVGSLDVQNCSFVGRGGPVVTADGTTQTRLSDCSFENVDYITIADGANNGTTTGDALILASNGVLALERVQIIGSGSQTSTTFDLVHAENAAITITDCQLRNNTVNNMVIGRGSSTVVLSGTTLDGNNFASGLFCEGIVDVTINGCAIMGNNFSTVRIRATAS